MNNTAFKLKQGYTAPMKETPATLRDVINIKSSLAVLLNEETNFMNSMQIGSVGELQDRKLKLTGLLERCMRYLTHHPEVVANVTAEEKAELKKVSDIFDVAMRKNYETLLVARAVNGAIVKCVTQSVMKKDQNSVYDARGAIGAGDLLPISITLNQTI
jgi:hypothetical protein